VVSVAQMSEVQLLYDPVYDLAISNHRSNAVFSDASRGSTVCFLGDEHLGFLKEEVNTYRMASMSPLNSQSFFFFFASAQL
jgi:hypothetical protein